MEELLEHHRFLSYLLLRINTYELAFDYNPTFNVHTAFNIFRYDISDFILSVPDNSGTTFTVLNIGAQNGQGLEWEIDWQMLEHLKLTANYAFQRSENKNTSSDAGNAPHHQVYTRLNWEFMPAWTIVPQLDWVMDRKRVAGDTRPNIKDYATVDLTLRRTDIKDHWELAFIIKNLFDADAREPSPFSQPAPAIPYDFPLPSRSFYGEVRYNF